MGGYIPPAGSSGSLSSTPTGSSGSSSTITIPDPGSLIPRNPSVGLKHWGPLVPASDNKMALSMLTTLQVAIGILGFHKARVLRRSNLVAMGIPNTFGRRTAKWSCVFGGSYMVFTAGLEITRLLLPYDPWAEEARLYRRLAVKNGDKPSWWFGAYRYFSPMPYTEWTKKTELWLMNANNYINTVDAAAKNGEKSALGHSAILRKLAEKGRYSDIHAKIRTTNREKYRNLVENDLKDVSEINKGSRIDLILEGKGPVHYNENYTKPHLQLGNHEMETDDDFEMVWMNFEPWEELKQETDYDIRLVPRWKWKNEETNEEVP